MARAQTLLFWALFYNQILIDSSTSADALLQFPSNQRSKPMVHTIIHPTPPPQKPSNRTGQEKPPLANVTTLEDASHPLDSRMESGKYRFHLLLLHSKKAEG
ncbi:hypothetical protein IWX49DRAFT_559929 [Phyllosticta citricarpa]